MCKRYFSVIIFSILWIFSSSSVMAQPVSEPQSVEISVQFAAQIRQIRAKDRKAIERDSIKHEHQKQTVKSDRPIADPPEMNPKPTPDPPRKPERILANDKDKHKAPVVQPLKDDEHRIRRDHQNTPKMKKLSKPVRELTPQQKECRIDRQACKQDCKAAQKICGDTKDCVSVQSACKGDCNKRFICH